MKRHRVFFLFFLSVAANLQGMGRHQSGSTMPSPVAPTPPPRRSSQLPTMPPTPPTSMQPTSPVRPGQPMSPPQSPAKFSTPLQQHQTSPSQTTPTSYQAPHYKFPTWKNPIALWQERRATSYMEKQAIDPKFSTEMAKLKDAPATVQKKGLETLQAIEKNNAKLEKIKTAEAALRPIQDHPHFQQYLERRNDRITKFINYVDGITDRSIPKDEQLSYKERNKTLLDFASDKEIAIMRKYKDNNFSSSGFNREERFKIDNLIKNSIDKGIVSKELQKEQMKFSRINQQKKLAEFEAQKLQNQHKQLFGQPKEQQRKIDEGQTQRQSNQQ
ncbi:hypothetical protein K2X40_00605 [Candidatus Babeliales bacterium]|nr:hypothetical protein [Candidatus Babeliales bacterium]